MLELGQVCKELDAALQRFNEVVYLVVCIVQVGASSR